MPAELQAASNSQMEDQLVLKDMSKVLLAPVLPYPLCRERCGNDYERGAGALGRRRRPVMAFLVHLRQVI